MHIKFLNFCDFPKQVLLIDRVATLINFRKLGLIKAAHLKDTKHLLLFIKQSKIIGQELYLERVRKALNHLKVKQIKQF